MKRCLPIMLMMTVRVCLAQDGPAQAPALPSSLPAPPPYALPYKAPVLRAQLATPTPVEGQPQTPAAKNVDMKDDGSCKLVKPGDVVHYHLTIRSADAARAVYANLQLRRNGGKMQHSDLPFPDPLTMGERGEATRDAQVGDLYHFEFTIEPDVPSGLYFGTDVLVTLSADGGAYRSPHYVDVTRHTRREIHRYCLAVVGPYGGEVGEGRPLVTDFKPGLIERK